MANKYSPIWELLKETGHATVAIPIPLHKRVLKGLVNLKDRDPGFKLMAEEKKKRYILEITSEQARVRIFLREYDNLSNITVNDL